MDAPEAHYIVSPLLAVLSEAAAAASYNTQKNDHRISRHNDQSICDDCRNIEFIDLPVDQPRCKGDASNEDGFRLTLIVDCKTSSLWSPKRTCFLCKALSNVYFNSCSDWFPVAMTEEWVSRTGDRRDKAAALRLEKQEESPPVFVTPCGEKGIFMPRQVSERYDRGRAKLWIANCTNHHPRCDGENLAIEGMRLVDCHTMNIVNAEPSSRWVALSYVWGLEDPIKPSQSPPSSDRRRLPHQIPATIKDAITVTVDVGYRYLWVDEYCIDQSQPAHKADQISKMDNIYRSADLTIVATGPNKHHGLPGVSSARVSKHEVFQMKGRNVIFTGPDPLVQTRRSIWMERAWTFQEGYLSKRLLVFTEHQMSFHCDTASWMEALCGLEYLKDADNIDWNAWDTKCSPYDWYDGPKSSRDSISIPDADWLKTPFFSGYKAFIRLAEQYSRRDLRYDSDALNAFSGVMHYLQRTHPTVYNFKGLPYIPWIDHVGLKEKLVFVSLSWHREPFLVACRRRPAFPSWTWAGWTGTIYWPAIGSPIRKIEDRFAFVRNVHFESEGPVATTASINSNLSQDFLDTVTAIHLDAPLIAAHYFSGKDSASIKSRTSWHDITIMGNRLGSYPSAKFSPKLFQMNLEQGIWSCMLLGYLQSTPESELDGCLLIVEWKDEKTAVRVWGFSMFMSCFVDAVDTLERRTVRLI